PRDHGVPPPGRWLAAQRRAAPQRDLRRRRRRSRAARRGDCRRLPRGVRRRSAAAGARRSRRRAHRAGGLTAARASRIITARIGGLAAGGGPRSRAIGDPIHRAGESIMAKVLGRALVALVWGACAAAALADVPVPAAGASPRIDAIRKAGVLRVGVLANAPWLVENTSGQGEAWSGPAWLLAKEYA